MDKVISTITNLDPFTKSYETARDYDAAARQYLAALQRLPEVARHMIVLQPKTFLSSVDPSANSVGFMFLLGILLHTNAPDVVDADSTHAEFVSGEIIRFLLNFDLRQIQFVGSQFRSLLENVSCNPLFPPSIAVDLLCKVITRLDPSGSLFTSAHLLLARLAYDTDTVGTVLPIIDSDILFFPTTRSARAAQMALPENDQEPDADAPSSEAVFQDVVAPGTILEYQLVRSLIYISRRDWNKAQAALEQLISHPARDKGVSKIMAEGHKKWMLVGLLNRGKAPALPSGVSSTAKTFYGELSGVYNELAAAFSNGDSAMVKNIFEKNSQTWQEDGNLSLAGEVVRAYQKWQIINLRRVYHKISVSRIRGMTMSAETGECLESDGEVELLVREMLTSGMLRGELVESGEESYLTFQEEYEAMTEADFTMAIAASHHKVEMLSKQYRAANERFSTNKEYIQHMVRQMKMAERGGADAGVGFDDDVEDEDLMTGVVSHA